MNRAFFWFAMGLVVVIATVKFSVDTWLSPYVKAQIETAVKEACPTCKFKFESLALSIFFSGDVTVENIDFSKGDPEATQVVFHAGEISFHVSLRALWKREVHIRNLHVDQFDIAITDGDQKSQAKPEPIKVPAFYIGATTLTGGKFQYVRNHDGTSATLHVSDIEAEVNHLDPQSTAVIRVDLSARYEKTGHASLEVKFITNPLLGPLQTDVKLTVKDQDLVDLSSFFEPNAGVILKGKIVDGVGTVSLRGNQLQATDWIVYEGLEAKVKKMKDRNGLTTFFENMGFGVSMQTKDTELEKPGQTRSVELTQESNESVISFILRGLKEASLKVATRSNR